MNFLVCVICCAGAFGIWLLPLPWIVRVPLALVAIGFGIAATAWIDSRPTPFAHIERPAEVKPFVTAQVEKPQCRRAGDMVVLRKFDPDAYLACVRSSNDLAKWLDEMKALKPAEYAAYEEEQRQKNQAVEEQRQRSNPKDYLTPTLSWQKGGFDNVLLANFTIKSTLVFPVKDIGIVCTTSGRSGSKLSMVLHTIHDAIPARQTINFARANLGFIDTQSTDANCSITSVKM